MKAKQKESHVVSEKAITAKNDTRNFDVNKIRIIVSDRKRNKEEAIMHSKSRESYKTYDLSRLNSRDAGGSDEGAGSCEVGPITVNNMAIYDSTELGRDIGVGEDAENGWRELIRDKFVKLHKNDFGRRDYKLDSDKSALSLHVKKIMRSNIK